jgi:hypothetical protein
MVRYASWSGRLAVNLQLTRENPSKRGVLFRAEPRLCVKRVGAIVQVPGDTNKEAA